MNEDESFEEFDPQEVIDSFLSEPVIDQYGSVKRAASIVGDLRKCLREEGFTKEETFALVQSYWDSEMSAF